MLFCSVAFAGNLTSCAFSCEGTVTPDSGIVPLHPRFVAQQIQQGCTGPAQWVWSFGDGATATTTDPTVYHYYYRPGTYTWTLTGTMDGAIATDSGTISVLPDPCKVECSATAEPSSGLEPLPVAFSSSVQATDCDEDDLGVRWDVGEDGYTWFADYTGFIYPWAGTFWWTMKAGWQCEVSGPVVVESPYCVPAVAGRWPFGTTRATARSGNMVVFGEGSALTVADASDPLNPVRLGTALLPDAPRAIVLQGAMAYVADDQAGLRVVDFSDPRAPAEVGHLETLDRAANLALSGCALYLACDSALRVVDVSVPSVPREISVLPHVLGTCSVATSEGFVYLAAEDALHIFDATDPLALREVGSKSGEEGGPLGSRSVVVRQKYAYCLGYETFHIVDASNPADPRLVGDEGADNYYGNLAVSGNTLVAPDYGGLDLYDLTDPAHPAPLSTLQGYSAYATSVDGSRMTYSSGGTTLWMVDLADPSVPVLQGSLLTDNDMLDVALQGDSAFLAMGDGGLSILNLAAPGGPTEVGRYRSGGASRVIVKGSYAYISSNGITILDVSDPSCPVAVGVYPDIPGGNLAVEGNTLCVASGPTLILVDVTDPAAAKEVGRFVGKGDNSVVAVLGDHAYVGYWYWPDSKRIDGLEFEALRVVDISNPASPRQVGRFDPLYGAVYAIGISGQNIVVLLKRWLNDSPMVILDVTSPENPVPLGTVQVPPGLLAVGSSAAFVADYHGVRVVDLSDPAHPTTRANYPVEASPWGVAAEGTRACIADRQTGMTLLDASPCLHPAPCVASVNPAPGIPLTFSFSTPVLPPFPGDPPTFRWSFGDGATSTEPEVTHTYAVPGSYLWSLTIFLGDRTCGRSGRIRVEESLIPGDCNGDGQVFIGEVQKAINIFLGLLPTGCGADCDGDGSISIGEVQKVINAFLGVGIQC